MAMTIYVIIVALLEVWLGVRYARWHKSHIGKRRNNRYPRNRTQMRDDTNVDE